MMMHLRFANERMLEKGGTLTLLFIKNDNIISANEKPRVLRGVFFSVNLHFLWNDS